MKYKVYEVEEKTTATGKELKKVVLQGEGSQYPDRNVTVWKDHPQYDEFIAGAEVQGSIWKQEQEGTKNPHNGKPYVNKTWSKLPEEKQTTIQDVIRMDLLESRIKKLEEKVFPAKKKEKKELADEIPF